MTKGAPIEGAAIIAREARSKLAGKVMNQVIDQCAEYIYTPGISVVRDAKVAAAQPGVTGMHDPTEGGVLGGVWEMAEASQCTFEVDISDDKSLWIPEAKQLCDVFDLWMPAVIASGALLITVKYSARGQLEAALNAEGIATYHLGTVMDGPG